MTTAPLQAHATARPNIALVKYWGKRDAALNLPAAGSLSITLDALQTDTRIHFDAGYGEDQLLLNGEPNSKAATRLSRFLDILRQQTDCDLPAKIDTHNNFPTAAGLASSASGFAALALAASKALGLPLDAGLLSGIARQGSGSAARSLFGGFVEMQAGSLADGSDAVAKPLYAPDHWPLEVVVAVTTTGPKAVNSTSGMQQTRATSPYHQAWIDSVEADISVARKAIAQRDFATLAEVSEHSCLKMHADMLATRPPLIYWTPASLACIQRIRELREVEGLPVFFTVDAGPQVKAVCLPEAANRVAEALQAVPGVVSLLRTGLGAGATLVDD